MSTVADPRAPRRRELRRQALWWGLALGAVAIIAAVIAATGGFAVGGEPYKGRQVQIGEEIDTRFWDVTVLGAEYKLDGKFSELKVAVEVTNKQVKADFDTTSGMFVARVPGAKGALTDSTCFAELGGDFQPLIRTRAVCDFTFDDERVPAPEPGTVLEFQFIVLDQRISRGFIDGSKPAAGEPVAWLSMTAEELVEEE